MTTVATSSGSTDLLTSLYAGRLSEDPHREPHEKETAIHIEGDSDHLTITSFKKVVFKKLLTHPDFRVRTLTVLKIGGKERTASLSEFLENPALTIIGVTGELPVGCLSIGVGRQSNSHAGIVK